MENKLIKGIDKMFWLLPKEIEKLEHAAMMHRRYSNIGFKVISVAKDTLIVRVYQGRHSSENYADRKRLIEIGHETFDDFLQGRKIHIGPVEFQYKDFVMVSITEDLGKTIDKYFKSRRDFLEYLNILGFSLDETTLSNHISGRKELTEWHRLGYSFALSFYKFNKGEEKFDWITILEDTQDALSPLAEVINSNQKALQTSLDSIKRAILLPAETQKSIQTSFDNIRKASESFIKVTESLKIKPFKIPTISLSPIQESSSIDKT